MRIESELEDLITLREAARLLPRRRRGKKPHISCLYRWTTTGCRGVVLESVSVGGTRCTSRGALSRFFSRLSIADAGGGSRPVLDTRQQHLDRVERELAGEGI
jgi:hypothetical protein